MKKIKSYIFYSLLSFQALCLLGVYIFSSKGIFAIQKARIENSEINQQIVKLQQEISFIEKEIQAWHTQPYVVEKIAREQFQLAKQDELIFMIQPKDAHV